MEELELEIRRGPNVEWCIFYAIGSRCVVELRQGVEPRCAAFNTSEHHHLRLRCPKLQEGLAVLIEITIMTL